jgi:hypothetical protein
LPKNLLPVALLKPSLPLLNASKFLLGNKAHVPDDYMKSIMTKLTCGSVAGLLGQTLTYPLEVVRRQMQVIYFIWLSRNYRCILSKIW